MSTKTTTLHLTRVDEEYGPEAFWAAVAADRRLARVDRLSPEGHLLISDEELTLLRSLPDWDGGPEYVRNPLLVESLDEWVEIDCRVRIIQDGADLRVSLQDSEEDPDDGHAEEVLTAAGLRLSLSGNGGGAEEGRYVESVSDWSLI